MTTINAIPTVLELQRGDPDGADKADRLPTLILVHPGAGLSVCYAKLTFRPERRVIAINQTWLTGRHSTTSSDDFSFDSIQDAASHYLAYLEANGWLQEEISWQKVFAMPAVAFGGWSYGGCMALEVSFVNNEPIRQGSYKTDSRDFVLEQMAHQISNESHDWIRTSLHAYSGILLLDAVHPTGIYDTNPQVVMDKLMHAQADSAIFSSSPAHIQDEELLDYLRNCYQDAKRLLTRYDTSHLNINGPVSLVKAGQASLTHRSLSNGARIQRIKNQLCQYNGWKDLAQLHEDQWLTKTLERTAHDHLFSEPHIRLTQAAVNFFEGQHRF